LNCPVVFISIPYSVIKNETVTEYDMETGVNILIDSSDIDMPFILDLVCRFNFHFIFSLPDNILNNDINSLLPSLYTLYTLSGCFSKCNNCIPVFANAHKGQIALRQIKDYFMLQGETNIKFNIFDSRELQIKDTTLLTNTTQLKLLDAIQIKQYTSLKINQIILSFGSPVQLNKELASIKMLKKENKYVDIFLEITATNNTASWNLHEFDLWQNRAKLYLSFIALGKEVAQKEYYDIKQWYHQEYEILPLWFKRLGHIVKVLMGKRSFRSLFSDNVKK
jgi:hypothetical protein